MATKPAPAEDFSDKDLNDILEHLGIRNWDALLVGDGSGTGWHMGAGSAVVVINRHQPSKRQLLWGAWSQGTVNIAELNAYVLGLAWYAKTVDDQAYKYRLRSVHILSDSQLTVDAGNGAIACPSLDFLWASVEALRRAHRLHLSWHFMDRDTTALNKLTDWMSREARLALEALHPEKQISGFDLQAVNPFRVSGPRTSSPNVGVCADGQDAR